jgi:hypothetical protein
MSHFHGYLNLRNADCKDDGQWVLTQDFVYSSDVLKTDVTVQAGFQTDLASVPRLWMIYALFGGKANEISVCHDAAYTFQSCTRRQADAMLYEGMLVTQDPKWVAICMWLGVRIGGWWAWAKAKKAKRQPILGVPGK